MMSDEIRLILNTDTNRGRSILVLTAGAEHRERLTDGLREATNGSCVVTRPGDRQYVEDQVFDPTAPLPEVLLVHVSEDIIISTWLIDYWLSRARLLICLGIPNTRPVNRVLAEQPAMDVVLLMEQMKIDE